MKGELEGRGQRGGKKGRKGRGMEGGGKEG